MESFFRRLIQFRHVVIVVVLGVTMLAVLQLPRLRFETDMEAIIPASDPVQHYNTVVEDRFGLGDLILLGVVHENPAEDNVFNPRTLRIVKDLSEQLALLPGIKAVRKEDVASVATMDNIVGTPEGLTVDPFMQAVPQTPADLRRLKQTVFGNATYLNWLVSQDETGLLIIAKMEPSDGTAASIARRQATYQQLQQMIQVYTDAGVPEHFYLAGRGPMEVTYAEDVRRDVGAFMPLVFLVVVGLLYATYRSLRGVLLPLMVVGVSVLWTLAIMASMNAPVDFVSTMMPVVLMALGVADGIHILSRYYNAILEQPEISSPEAVVVAMLEMWKPVVLTSLTTAAGFLSFLTSVLVPVHHFGLFSAIGILAAMLVSLTLFPAVLSLLSPQVSQGLRRQMSQSGELMAAGWATRSLTRLGRGVARHPLLVWVPTVVVIGMCLVGARRIVVDTSWIDVMHPHSPIRIADEVLRQKFQGTLPLYITIEGHAPELLKDPTLLHKLDRLQAEVEKDPAVGGSLSLAEFIKRMHRVMNEDRPAMEVVPPSRELIAQYLLLYSLSGDPDDFEEVVDYDYRNANVAVYLRSDRTQDIMRVVQQVQDFATREFGRASQPDGPSDGLRDMLFLRFGRWLGNIDPIRVRWKTKSDYDIGFAGPAYLLTRTNELVVAGQLSSLVTSLGAGFLLTACMFRSFSAGVIIMLPTSLVILFSFGLLGLLHIPLEVGKSMTASMVIGIGVDYTIHFLHKYRLAVQKGLTDPESITVETMATAGKAIFFNAAVVVGGFLVLLTSRFRPNFYLGAMLALTMSACLLVSMTVLPTILNTLKPRFVYGGRSQTK